MAGSPHHDPMTMMPRHVELRLRSTLADLHGLAEDRGMDRAFAMELFFADRNVQDALAGRAAGGAEGAFEELKALARRIMAASARTPGGASDGGLRVARGDSISGGS